MSAGLACREVSVTLGGRRVLAGVTADVRPGELTSILGPNGSGKSTRTVRGRVRRADGGHRRRQGARIRVQSAPARC